MANLRIAHKIATERDAQQKLKDKERHDLIAKVQIFGIGNQVLIKMNKIPKGLSRKLHDKADGPYRIIALGPNYTYELRDI